MLPSFGYYEIQEIKINYRYDDPDPKESFVSGSDKDTKQRFIFTKRLAEEKLFRDRDKALNYINQKKEDFKDVKYIPVIIIGVLANFFDTLGIGSYATSTTAFIFSVPPMLPGLILILSAPFSMAIIAIL